jgi:predicted PurR-regulated permease PerM
MTLYGQHPPLLIVLVIAASIAFLALIGGFWQPIFWAAVIGVLFRPVHLRLARRLADRRSLAAGLTLILIFFTVLLPAMLLASILTAEAAGVFRRIQSGELDVGAVIAWVKAWIPPISDWAASVGVDIDALSQKLSQAAVNGSRFIASLALRAGQNAATFVLMFALMLYLLFFILRDSDRMVDEIKRVMPLPAEHKARLFSKLAEVSRATVKGTLIVGLVQGGLGGLAFAVLGIQGAVFWGVVMVILSVLPAVGTGLVWGPAAIYLITTGDWAKGAFLIGFGVLVIGLVDNFLRPILVGRDTKMPDYLILFSTLGGLSLVGITGFVLGPMIAALFLTSWQMFAESPPAESAASGNQDRLANAQAETDPHEA